jgi:hypothetical protein
MKYTIVGSGPCGLSLAYILATNGYNVEIIEKNNQLGGSWNSQWIENKYFSENSPRVLVYDGYTKKFLNEIGIKDTDLSNIYGTIFQQNLKILNFIKQFFNWDDYFKFIYIISKYKLIKTNDTVETIINKSSLSDSSKKFIRIFCILINDTSNKTNINDFCGTFNIATTPFKQFKNSNQWHNLIQNKLHTLSNVKIYKNTEFINILQKNNSIIGYTMKQHNKNYTKSTNKIFLCTQSNGILSILNKSDKIIQNNWNNYKYIKNWCKNTYYSGFGFQLHFNKTVPYPHEFCKYCISNWNIIILPVGDWLIQKSKDPHIKSVWSCVIVDMNSKSTHINKTVNECTSDEILKESLYQLNKIKKIPKPYKITLSNGLKKINNIWISENTGFTRATHGYLPMKGKIHNLYALGSFTDTNYNHVAYMETSIRASIEYLNKYEPHLLGFHKYTYNLYIIFLIILIIMFIYFKHTVYLFLEKIQHL